jgi:hypothetical protein
MTHITLSDSMRSQLGRLNEPLVLRDEAGNPLGTFAPVAKLTEHQRIAMTLPDHLLDSTVPTEELDRRFREEPRIPHEEVMERTSNFDERKDAAQGGNARFRLCEGMSIIRG